jgi:hypothetical protein
MKAATEDYSSNAAEGGSQGKMGLANDLFFCDCFHIMNRDQNVVSVAPATPKSPPEDSRTEPSEDKWLNRGKQDEKDNVCLARSGEAGIKYQEDVRVRKWSFLPFLNHPLVLS